MRVNHSTRLMRQGYVEAQYIRVLKDFAHVSFLPQFIGEPVFIFIVYQNLTSETAESFRERLTHVSETDNADRLVHDLGAAVAFAQPYAVDDFLVGARNISQEAEKNSDGKFSDGVAVSFRCVEHADVFFLEKIQVEVVDPGAGASDKSQRGIVAEQVAVDHSFAADDHTLVTDRKSVV